MPALTPLNPRKERRFASRRGVALVIMLSFIVLLAVVVVAFFSRAVSDRQASNSSAGQAKADLLARSSLEVIVGDLKQEIALGSSACTAGSLTIYTPQCDANVVPVRSYPGLTATVDPIPNLIRESGTSNAAITLNGTAVGIGGGASAVSSTTPSVNGRSVTPARWNSHYLIPRDPTLYSGVHASTIGTVPLPSFTAPCWIYVTGTGPVRLSGTDPKVVGRYAYAIYDEGGLLNANVAGYPSGTTPDQYGPKGSLCFADLSVIGIPNPNSYHPPAYQVDTLVGWRNFATIQPPPGQTLSGNYDFHSSPDYAGRFCDYALHNKGGFLTVNPVVTGNRTDQCFVSRQSLLKFRRLTAFTQNALQFLGTFSREKNAPSWSPALDAPSGGAYAYKTNANSDTAFNRNLANVRVKTAFTRPDGSPAKVGDVLLKKRFSLNRLGLITLAATEDGTGDIYKCFGLKRASATAAWTYDHGAPAGTIATLEQVSQAGREPDFFELLQAAILNGSLGKSGGNTLAQTDGLDSNPYYQIIQIGANIIDQYDSDSFPTTISFDGQDFYGIENLPYLNQIFVKAVTGSDAGPSHGPSLHPFFLFQLWNPHDAALSGTSASGPTAVRIRPTAGQVRYWGASDPAVGTAGLFTFDGSQSISIPALDFPLYAQPRIPAAPVEPLLGVSALPIRSVADPLYDTPGGWVKFDIPSPTQIVLEYQDSAGWHPYSTFAGRATLPATGLWNDPQARFTDINGDQVTGNNLIPYPLELNQSEKDQDFGPITSASSCWHSLIKSDPRTSRFGASFSSRPRWGPPAASTDLNGKLTQTARPTTTGTPNSGNGYQALYGKPILTGTTPPLIYYPGLLAQNTTAGQQYADRDGVFRPGDGAGVTPAGGQVNPLYDPASNPAPSAEDKASRPVLLNRPFRSVGELAYVFRDQPWKSLDFNSKDSADAGLLDIFSVDESEMTAARVNLNTRQTLVLEAIISGAFKTYSAAGILTPVANPTELAYRIATSGTQLGNRADLPKIYSQFTLSNSAENKVKAQREAAVRALSETTCTRTWNLLIDVVAQSGRFTSKATSLAQFVVEGEKRFWLHVAIDRFTGEVIDEQLEPVYE